MPIFKLDDEDDSWLDFNNSDVKAVSNCEVLMIECIYVFKLLSDTIQVQYSRGVQSRNSSCEDCT